MNEIKLIKIPDIATVSNIEQEFYKFFNNNSGLKAIAIDFSEVKYIEPSTSTTYLIAILNCCLKEGIRFTIIPPRINGIRIILYTWRFFEVLEETTGITIKEFAPALKNDFSVGKEFRVSSTKGRVLKYYNNIDDNQYRKFFKERYLDENSIIFLTTREKFFPLTSFEFSTESLKYKEFDNEKERWSNNGLINEVLSNNLAGIDIDQKITDNVICEAISNAILHPNSDKFFTGSFFDFKDDEIIKQSNNSKNVKHLKRKKTFLFTINFWDNGDSIIKTLRNPIDNNLPFKSEFSERQFQKETKTKIEELIFIVKKKGNGYQIIDTTIELNTETPNEEILLASFFPGISREPNRKINLFSQTVPGIGLSYLMDTIVNILGGEIAIRTSYYFINIRKANKGDKMKYIEQRYKDVEEKPKIKEIFPNEFYYAARIKKIKNKMPEFLGNMITVRMPIKYKL